ncbi:MAG: DUF1214 domain-containing protein [Actinobacteria bacterium]|nr:DUF1214 domain-containing protein [Actinomycetota bacterium]
MLDEMTEMVTHDAETELELVEGLRVLGRITALCSELSLDVDVEAPWFFPMNSHARYVGGPNPDGEYHLAMISGRHRYRVTGTRGTVAYLGFQVLAASGLTPRRMAAYVSDTDLEVDADGRFRFVLSARKPAAGELAGDAWVEIPPDASAMVVRQYIADPARETAATYAIEPLDPPGSPALPTDGELAQQFTAMAWTIWKLATLHRTIKPELLEHSNELVTAEAADLGAADTTPDNLYMIGTFRLEPREALVLDFTPPPTRYWSVTLENIWHECIDVRRRRSSLTSASATVDGSGSVTIVVAADDPGSPNWLDTGRRHRGFVLLRWLDNPAPPAVRATVVDLDDVKVC